jgi:hypothetical protein
MLFAGGAKGITLDRDKLCLSVVDVEAEIGGGRCYRP